jgi:hypothetical protein
MGREARLNVTVKVTPFPRLCQLHGFNHAAVKIKEVAVLVHLVSEYLRGQGNVSSRDHCKYYYYR